MNNKPIKDPNIYCDLEFGYRLKNEYQNKGFGTILGKAMCNWAFQNPKIDRIVAVVAPQNIQSQKAITKIGFQYIQDVKTEEYGIEKFYCLYKHDNAYLDT